MRDFTLLDIQLRHSDVSVSFSLHSDIVMVTAALVRFLFAPIHFLCLSMNMILGFLSSRLGADSVCMRARSEAIHHARTHAGCYGDFYTPRHT